MQTQKIIALTTLSLVLIAFVALSTAQAANVQPTQSAPNPNSNAPPCIASNTGANSPPCWSNSPNRGACGECCVHSEPGPCWK